MEKNANVRQQNPAQYNGLVYVLHGTLTIGNTALQARQVGWLNKVNPTGQVNCTVHLLETIWKTLSGSIKNTIMGKCHI